MRQRFIEAVRGFGRGWGLLSKKGEELAREDARRPVFIGGGTFSRGDGRGKPMSLDESLRKAKAEASAWNATHSRTVPKRRASIDEL